MTYKPCLYPDYVEEFGEDDTINGGYIDCGKYFYIRAVPTYDGINRQYFLVNDFRNGKYIRIDFTAPKVIYYSDYLDQAIINEKFKDHELEITIELVESLCETLSNEANWNTLVTYYNHIIKYEVLASGCKGTMLDKNIKVPDYRKLLETSFRIQRK